MKALQSEHRLQTIIHTYNAMFDQIMTQINFQRNTISTECNLQYLLRSLSVDRPINYRECDGVSMSTALMLSLGDSFCFISLFNWVKLRLFRNRNNIHQITLEIIRMNERKYIVILGKLKILYKACNRFFE